MKRKSVVLFLSLAMAVTTLSACEGKDGGTEQKAETSAEKTDTKNGDAEKADTEEAAETDKADKVNENIIPLFKAELEDRIKEIAPADLLKFDNFSYYFPISVAETDNNGRQVYKYENIDSFDLKIAGDNFDEMVQKGFIPEGTDPETITTIKLTFSYDQMGDVSIETVSGENKEKAYNFIPLFYDKNKDCLVGYDFTTDEDGWETPSLEEIYYDNRFYRLGYTNPVDPADYGFTSVPTADTVTGDELIPLFKTEFKDEIMSVSPADLYSFENFSHYFPVREVITDENGFFIYAIENENSMEMRDWDYFKYLEDGTRHDVNYYFYGKADGSVIPNYWSVDGYSDPELDSQVITAKDYFSQRYDKYEQVGRQGFLPLFFNKTRGCFVGYEPLPSEDWFDGQYIMDTNTPEYKNTGYSIKELYYDSYGYGGNEFYVDPALYGFK